MSMWLMKVFLDSSLVCPNHKHGLKARDDGGYASDSSEFHWFKYLLNFNLSENCQIGDNNGGNTTDMSKQN